VGNGLSGSTIKNWFQYNCERKSRYESMAVTDLSAIPIIQDTRENEWAIKGNAFEDVLVAHLARSNKVLRPVTSSDKFSKLSDSIAHKFLRGEVDAAFAAQMNIKPDGIPAFLSKIEDIEIRTNLPDLVRRDVCDGKTVFTIIDVKATRRARTFHKAQVAFYAHLLEARLRELGIKAQISNKGEIWRFPDEGPVDGRSWAVDTFDLGPYRRQVQSFCETDLPEILAAPVSKSGDGTFFHVYFKCEQCKFLPHCEKSISKDLAPGKRDVSAVAGLSHQAKKSLLKANIRTVSDLAATSPEAALAAGAGWTLTRRIESLIVRAQALRDEKIGPGSEINTFLMPPRPDVALYLVADADPIDDQLATLGYLYVDQTGDREMVRVLPKTDRNAEAATLIEVFREVIKDLEDIDAFNQTADEDDQKRAHIFIYENAEADYLQQAVKRHLENPDIRGGLLNLVRLFPPEEVIPEPEFRGVDHLPASSVRSSLEQIFALPVTVAHDLRQVSMALKQAGAIETAYQPREPFARPFSSLLSIDIVRGLRENRANAIPVQLVEDDVIERLRATKAIAEWIFSEHEAGLAQGRSPLLRLKKKPFRLQETFDPINLEDLDTLKALELLENRSGKLAALVKLSRSKQVRRQAGRTIGPLKLLPNEGKKNVMVFQSEIDLSDTELSSDSFGVILSDGEPDSVLEPSLWHAYHCTIKNIYPRRVYIHLDRSVLRNQDRERLVSRMSAAGNADWWVDEIFLDLNTNRVDQFLTFLGGADA